VIVSSPSSTPAFFEAVRSPPHLLLAPREGEVKDERTYHFCPEHRDQLFDLKWSRTLPPEEWFAPGFVPDVRS
jgi:hypothetical protein